MTKEIRYDRETKDFGMYLDGELVGYERTYLAAEVRLNAIAHARLTKYQG